MPENPICPSCAKPMKTVRRLPSPEGEPISHIFECASCGVSFMTEDHQPTTGKL
jgi:ribosomal protein L37AE/L43A